MSEVIIRVEDLGKKYIIGHESKRQQQTFREMLTSNIGGLFRKTKELVQKGYAINGNIEEEFWAIKNINFEIKQGDRVGIIGRNGAGKSTLLKVLSRITEPTTGRIKIRGRVASLLEVGTGFHPELTGRENIFLNGAILGMTRAEIRAKFDEIVAFAEIEKFLDTPVKRYSSGMYVRLAFAVAAHLEPEILIVDEVLAVGDAQFQKKCLGKMQDVSMNEGRTVLFVSHNMAAISALCDRGILLQNGAVKYDGNVDEALKQYLDNRKIDSGGEIVFTGDEVERFGDKVYAKWISIKLFNQDNQITDCFVMGDRLKIALELDVIRPADDFEIGIGIASFQEVYMHYLVSPWEGFTSLSKKGRTTLEVELPRINLFPGNYIITIWICIKGAYYDDAVHSAISFRVDEGKVNDHDTYFERFSKNTQVYTPSTWTIKS